MFFNLCVRSSLIFYSVVELSGALPNRGSGSAANVSETYTGGLGLYLGSYTNREIGVVGREYSRSGGPSMGTSGNVPKNWMAVIT